MKRSLLCLLLVLCFLVPQGAMAMSAEDFIVSDEVEETDRMYFWARMIMSHMSLEEKIAQMFIVCPEDLSGESYTLHMSDALRTGLNKYPVGGVILFGQNIADENQLKKLIDDMQAYAWEHTEFSMFVAAEEEGGNTSGIVHKLGLSTFSSMAEIGESGNKNLAHQHGQEMAEFLKLYGFNMNLAPVADVVSSNESQLGQRAFGQDAEIVADMSCAVMMGLQKNGVASVLKHFPGHGSVEGNMHNGVHNINQSLETLRTKDFVPFVKGIGNEPGAVLVSCLRARSIDNECPAAMSYKVITETLRGELGYDGVVLTDSLRQKVIRDEYSAGKAAAMAVEAGADILLLPENFEEAYQRLLREVREGTITEDRIDESVTRILMLKIRFGLVN